MKKRLLFLALLSIGGLVADDSPAELNRDVLSKPRKKEECCIPGSLVVCDKACAGNWASLNNAGCNPAFVKGTEECNLALLRGTVAISDKTRFIINVDENDVVTITVQNPQFDTLAGCGFQLSNLRVVVNNQLVALDGPPIIGLLDVSVLFDVRFCDAHFTQVPTILTTYEFCSERSYTGSLVEINAEDICINLSQFVQADAVRNDQFTFSYRTNVVSLVAVDNPQLLLSCIVNLLNRTCFHFIAQGESR